MAPGDYEAVLTSLYALEAARGMDFKLHRVAAALDRLGNPHLAYPVIHLAGTNGKGSVAAMLESIQRAEGRQVGLYTSPHLVRFSERIRIGEREISPEEVLSGVAEVRRAAEQAHVELTFFEFVTVLAFRHFAVCQVPLAVIETGLGGRLDATNVVLPEVSVLTSIGFDHEEFLGSSLASIAAEKAGILKEGRSAVVGPLPLEAGAVVREAARRLRVPLRQAGEDFLIEATSDGWEYRDREERCVPLRVGLKGDFQVLNASLAVAASLALPAEFRPRRESIEAGLEQVRWPGRLEVVCEAPRIVVDGAHNPAAVEQLLAAWDEVAAGRPVHLLFSVMRDKRWPEMVDRLATRVESVTVTEAHPARATGAEEVAARFAGTVPVRALPDVREAMSRCVNELPEGRTLLVCGSLFLVGALREWMAES